METCSLTFNFASIDGGERKTKHWKALIFFFNIFEEKTLSSIYHVVNQFKKSRYNCGVSITNEYHFSIKYRA